MHMTLSLWDQIVLIAYLGLLWGIGLWVSYRHRKHAADFMLTRQYRWFNIGSSIFATNIGPSFLLGSASAAYAAGMATANFEWLAWIFLFLLGMFCAPHYIRMRITTMPEFIRRRFGNHAADFLSCYGLFTVVIMWIGGDLFVGGKLLQQLLGYDELACMVALALVFMTFTVAGGFSAVMVTDTAQAILMIVSMLVLNVLAFAKVGSVGNLVDRVPGEFWQLFRPADDSKYPWVAIVLGYPVIGFWFWCTDQTIVQRMLGARDLKQAQLGTVYTGFLKILPPFLFMMPGIFCLVLQPGLAKSDDAFVTMLTHYMPVGMLGLMLAVLFAASVAGVAGGLNAFSTIFTMDIYKHKVNPAASDRHLKWVSQVTIVAVTLAAVCAAMLLQGSKKNVFDTLQSIICYFAPPIASIFFLGLLWKRVTATAVKVTLYAGVGACLSIGAMNIVNWPSRDFWPHFMLLTFLLFVCCLVLLVVASLCTRHAPYEVPFEAARTGAAAEAADRGAGKPGWAAWAVLSVVMVCLYAGFQALSQRQQQVELYVAPGHVAPEKTGTVPEGNDANPGTARKPFRTLARARKEIELRKAGGRFPPGGIRVWLHDGVYEGTVPLFLGTEDSGVAGSPVSWRAFPGERPVAACAVPVGAEHARQGT